jgi:hypothetical protein
MRFPAAGLPEHIQRINEFSFPKLTWSTASQKVYDCQQDYRAEQRNEQRANTEIILIDRAGSEQGRQQPAAEQGTHNTYNDIHQHALLCIGLHDHACNPTEDAANYYPDNEIHF